MTAPTPLEKQQVAQSGSRLGTFWHRARSIVVTDLLGERDTLELVDVGAGAGHLGGWLAERRQGWRYRFEEPIGHVRGRLAERFGPDNEVGPGEPVPTADAVTLLDVLEHIEHADEFLADLAARMRDGALLVLTVPAMPVLFSGWDRALGHYRRYRRRDLVRAVRGAGFDVVRCEYLFPELVVPALVRRLRGKRYPVDAAEFPDVPPVLDRMAFGVLRISSRLRRIWPIGTSLVLVGRR